MFDGRFVSGIRRLPAIGRCAPPPDAAIAPRERPRPGSITAIRIVAVVTAIMTRRPAIATLDKFALDVATLVHQARSRSGIAAMPAAAGRAAVSIGRVRMVAVIGILIVAGLRRRRGHERAEQCEDACDDQCRQATSRRADTSMT